VCCARRRFYQSSLDSGQLLELEHKIRRIFGILCKDSINHNAMGNEILTEQPLALTAVVAVTT
jgi:hypothetical protein